MDKKIILASSSPRRAELMKSIGVPFEVLPSGYEEDMALPLAPDQLAKHLAIGKAEAVAKFSRNAIVIAADTFVVFSGKIMGKPQTKERAREMLSMLSGNAHSVITGLAIIDTDSGRIFSETVETKVRFRQLSNSEIDNYIATGEPLDKAGAYGIQGLAQSFVESIDGSYSN